MLTVRALSDLMAKNHFEEAKPFHPILAAEEPEAHLHPNAQRALYDQLIKSPGQVIVSTHSPYLGALANPSDLRGMNSNGGTVEVTKLTIDPSKPEEIKKLHREILHSRGELLFSRALVLFEGETEEQSLPSLFKHFTGNDPFAYGINFVSVNGSGARYRPFLQFGKDFHIPVFIFSDGEEKTVRELKKVHNEIYGESDVENSPYITILDGTDFEGYLLTAGYQNRIEAAIEQVRGPDCVDSWKQKRQGTPTKPKRTTDPPCVTCSQPIYGAELRDYNTPAGHRLALLEILDSQKPLFARAIADELCKCPVSELPPQIAAFFDQIKTNLSL